MNVTITPDDWPESFLQARVVELAQTLGYTRIYHTYRSKKSQPGFPDLVLVGRGRVVFVELKAQDGRLSAAQRDWIDTLQRNGAEVYVWRPRDLQAAAEVLSGLRVAA